MKQLSIRGFGRELERRLKEIAREKSISLNKAALFLLRKGAGLDRRPGHADVVGDSLDHLMGCWTEEEEKKFLENVEAFEGIDDSLWS